MLHPAMIQQMQSTGMSIYGRPIVPNKVRVAMEFIAMLQQKDMSAMHVACHTEGTPPEIKSTDKERACRDAACHLMSQYFMGEVDDVTLEAPAAMSMMEGMVPSPMGPMGALGQVGSLEEIAQAVVDEATGLAVSDPGDYNLVGGGLDEDDENEPHPIVAMRNLLEGMGVDSGSVELLLSPYVEIYGVPEDE